MSIAKAVIATLSGLANGELQRQRTKKMMDRQSMLDDERRAEIENRNVIEYLSGLKLANKSGNEQVGNFYAGKLNEITGKDFNYAPIEKPQVLMYQPDTDLQEEFGFTEPLTFEQRLNAEKTLSQIRKDRSIIGKNNKYQQPQPKPTEGSDQRFKFQLKTLEREIQRLRSVDDPQSQQKAKQLYEKYLQMGNGGKALDDKEFEFLMTGKPRNDQDVYEIMRQQGLPVDPADFNTAKSKGNSGKLKPWYE